MRAFASEHLGSKLIQPRRSIVMVGFGVSGRSQILVDKFHVILLSISSIAISKTAAAKLARLHRDYRPPAKRAANFGLSLPG
jgi:hypothetical protein